MQQSLQEEQSNVKALDKKTISEDALGIFTYFIHPTFIFLLSGGDMQHYDPKQLST